MIKRGDKVPIYYIKKNDELSHKEREWDDHKYVAKIPLKNKFGKKKYRYFYDLAEYKKYLKEQKEKKFITEKKIDESDKKTLTTSTKATLLKKEQEKKEQDEKSWFDKFISAGKKIVSNIISTGSKIAVSLFNTADEAIDEIIDAGEKLVKDIIEDIKETRIEYDRKTSLKEQRENEKKETVPPLEKENPKSFEELSKKEEEWSKDEDQNVINPFYVDVNDIPDKDWILPDDEFIDKYPYTNNCAYCTTAYDLRQRGYDVVADGISVDNIPEPTTEGILSLYEGDNEFDYHESHYDMASAAIQMADEKASSGSDEWWNIVEEELESRYRKRTENILEELAKNPEGSRGQLCVVWLGGGGGHSMVWEIENGKAIVRDCQSNDTYRTFDEIHYLLERSSEVQTLRTDNLKPTELALNWVVNRR